MANLSSLSAVKLLKFSRIMKTLKVLLRQSVVTSDLVLRHTVS